MAKLTGRVALPEQDYRNYLANRRAGIQSEHDKAAHALFEKSKALPDGVIEGAIIKFPMADGYALYLVTRDTGRTVEVKHIPYGDAWQVHPATIRGLRRRDIVEMVRRERALDAIFANNKQKQNAAKKGPLF